MNIIVSQTFLIISITIKHLGMLFLLNQMFQQSLKITIFLIIGKQE